MRVSRTDLASLLVPAPRSAVYAALTSRSAVERWLPPADMTGRITSWDLAVGYRMVLAYRDESRVGKSGANQDATDVRFVSLVPGERVEQEVHFESDDPALAGTMTMTWALSDVDGGTLVEIRADGVPEGISPEDHAVGMRSSLAQLADYLAAPIALTPEPPYTAVIFTSLLAPAPDGYAEMSARMEELALSQPGFLGIESARDGVGITVSYWAREADAAAWKQVAEHLVAQRLGQERWYADYRVRVATVTREYGPGGPEGGRH